MTVHLESPYDPSGAPGSIWLRGNLHTHTTRSDGTDGPQVMIGRYADLGYDFLMLSDHDTLSDYDGLDARGLILLRGNEVSGSAPHVLDVGARVLIPPAQNHQQLLDAINAQSGFPVLCHPNWEEDYNHYPFPLMEGLKGYVGVEIFNGLCLDLAGSAQATDKWDRLLSAGRRVWGFANDDAHKPEHVGRAWNVVHAAERSGAGVFAALRRGNFYASTGVRIEQIQCAGSVLTVRAANADRLAVIGLHSARLFVCDGAELRFDAADVAGPYIRVECYGSGGDMAWTQPLFIRGGKYDQLQSFLAQMESQAKSVLRIHRAARAPAVTGRVDDPLWQEAEAFDRFMQLRDGQPAPVRTEVRALLAGDTLYFGLRCEEPRLEEIPATTDQAGVWSTDNVELFLDVEGAGVNCYHVLINASGQTTAACRGPKQADNPRVSGRAGRYDAGERRGWSAEFVLPLAQLKTPYGPGTRWGLHLCRNRRPERGTYVWSWVGSSNHNRAQYGSLMF